MFELSIEHVENLGFLYGSIKEQLVSTHPTQIVKPLQYTPSPQPTTTPNPTQPEQPNPNNAIKRHFQLTFHYKNKKTPTTRSFNNGIFMSKLTSVNYQRQIKT